MAKMRSPNYPAVGLGESLERVRRLWAKEKRTPVDYAVASEAIGYSGLSGPSRTMLASMKKYGLVESDDKAVRVSDLALRILHPANDYEELSALQEAALNPDLFRQLFETLKDASDGALKSHLITRLGFSEVGAKQLIKSYRDTITVSKLDKPLDSPSVGGVEPDPSESFSGAGYFQPVTETSQQADDRMAKIKAKFQSANSQAFVWPLAPGITGEVKIMGSQATPQLLRAISRYIEVAAELLQAQQPEPQRQLGPGQQS
jgi:hypothetical protein